MNWEDNTREEMIEHFRRQIIDYADNDKECGWQRVGKYKFPKRALIHFVFGKMSLLDDILPEYEAFSPMGLKLGYDNPFHSDVWLGAGFKIDKVYKHGSKKSDALHEAVFAIEKEFKNKVQFDFTVLANGMNRDRDDIRCMVYEYDPPLGKDHFSNIHVDCADAPKDEWDQHRCIVIPHAGIEFDLAARNADVIITEIGGPLAHLSTVSREKGKLLIRIDNALERFTKFTRFYVDPVNMKITPSDY